MINKMYSKVWKTAHYGFTESIVLSMKHHTDAALVAAKLPVLARVRSSL